jgi:hypothetical protein
MKTAIESGDHSIPPTIGKGKLPAAITEIQSSKADSNSSLQAS